MLRTVIFLCTLQYAALVELPTTDTMKESIASCILQISDKYFLKTQTIAVVFPDTAMSTGITHPIALDQQGLGTMFQSSAWSIFIKTTSKHWHFFSKFEITNNYIIQTRNPEDMEHTLRFLKLSSWNPHAKFVIVTTTLFENPLDVVTKIFQILWLFHVLNAVILIPRVDDQSTLDIYTWFPYAGGNCGDHFNESVLINQCRMGEMLNTTLLFPEKIPDNLHGCPVTVRTVVWPPFVILPPHLNLAAENVNFTEGTEIKLMNTIAEYANFTVRYRITQKKQDFGDMLSNGTATAGLLRELVQKNVDIGIAALAATKKRMTYLDYTISYATDSITWCVPTAELEPQWLSIIKILNLNTWLATMAAFVTVILIIWTISMYSLNESATFRNFGSCSLYMFRTTLGIPVHTLPKDTHVRIVYLMWIIYSFYLCGAFQSSLVSKLTDPSHVKQISTLQDMFKARMNIGYLPIAAKYFEDNSSLVSRIVRKYGEVCDDAEECLNRVALQRDFALALPRLYLLYVSERYWDKSGKSLIYWFKANTVSYPVQMFVYKGFPLLKTLNKVISRINAGGFTMKWLEEAMMGYSSRWKVLLVAATDDDGADALTFQHMQGAFTILAIGLSLGTVSFIGEQLVFHLHQHTLRRKYTRQFIM